MVENIASSGFDWDRDQESLVQAPMEPCVVPRAAPAAAWYRRYQGKLCAAALCAVFALAFAYEKDALPGTQSGAALSLDSLAPVIQAITAPAVPSGLVAYDERQAQRFLRELRLADMQTLHVYQVRIDHDLSRADPNLLPFHRDAKLLLTTELARRGANAS